MTDRKLPDASVMLAFTHDLRAHLRTVLTRIQLVQHSSAALLPRQDLSMLDEAAVAARAIDGLLGAMVAYTEGQAEDGVENLRLLLRGLLLTCKGPLREAGAEVEIANDLDIPVPAGLKNVLKELLTNACRFRSADRPPRILIAGRSVPDAVEIAVSDNGIGLEPAYLERIFVPFARLHSHGEFPGYGLGLATCRRIVSGWGGSISAETKAEPGLTLRITIPSGQTD